MPFKKGAFVLPTKASECLELADTVRAWYAPRDKRYDRDQKLFEMAESAQDGKIEVTLNDGKVLVQKCAAMVGAKPPRISVAARRIEDDQLAQRVENFLYWWRDEAETRHTQGVRMPLVHEEALWMFLRGWICGRLSLYPEDPKFPWCYTLLDPATVYPRLAGNKTLYIAQKYRPTVAEVLGEWPEAEKVLKKGIRDEETVDFSAIYTDREFAVLVDSEFVVKPHEHEYGFNPVLCVVASGAPYRATAQRPNWQQHYGTGILDAVYQPILDKAELALMLRAAVAREAEPPVVVYSADEERVGEVDMRPGGRTVLGVEDRAEPLNIGPHLQDLMALMQMHQQSIGRGAVGDSVFADGPKLASGFQEAVAAGSARDMMFPYVRAMERYYGELYRRVLTLFGQYGLTGAANAINYVSTDDTSGRRTAADAIHPEEIQGADLIVEVKFRDVTPQNEAAKASIGAQAAQLHILDMDQIRDRYFDVDDTAMVDEKVIGDLIKTNPQLIQMLSPMAAAYSSNPLVAQGAMMMLQQMFMAGMQPPGGAGPTGGPPDPNMQPANNQLPDEMGSGAGLPPGSPSPPGESSPGGTPPSPM